MSGGTALGGVHAQYVALGDTWRDQEYEKFRQEFEQALASHQRLTEVSAEFIPFLMRKAERIEEYLSQR